MFGAVMLVRCGADLMATARQAQGGITFWAEVFGWFADAHFVRSMRAGDEMRAHRLLNRRH